MIREATPDDAHDVGEVQLRSWHWNYKDLVDPAVLAEHDPEEREAWWASLLATLGVRAWVADVEGRVVGIVAVVDTEVHAICVDPSASGAGLGKTLMRHAEQQMAAAGLTELHVGCLAAFEPGLRFCTDLGWLREGEVDDPFGPTVRFRKPLG